MRCLTTINIVMKVAISLPRCCWQTKNRGCTGGVAATVTKKYNSDACKMCGHHRKRQFDTVHTIYCSKCKATAIGPGKTLCTSLERDEKLNLSSAPLKEIFDMANNCRV